MTVCKRALPLIIIILTIIFFAACEMQKKEEVKSAKSEIQETATTNKESPSPEAESVKTESTETIVTPSNDLQSMEDTSTVKAEHSQKTKSDEGG